MFEDDHAAIAHLKRRGYVLTRAWNWVKPANLERPSAEDRAAADYLFEEWDWGHFVEIKQCPFCGGRCDPFAAGGPICMECEACAPDLTKWQRRV